ncbi:MAG TPA: hypothetical protein VFA45_02620, partial [Actinomycetes bacterium]|nr:hypothetical protein [Actinomycetes bacterium]
MRTVEWRRRAAAVLLGMTVALSVIGPRAAWAGPSRLAQRQLTVASYNLYLGADLTRLFSATTPAELVERAGQVYA